MPFIRKPRWLLSVGGVEMTAGAINLNFSLGPNTVSVADIEITSPMVTTPALRTAIELDLGDRETELRYPVFRGEVQRPLGISYPNSVSVQAAGYLSRLRDIWDLDTDFTGMTDGEIIEAALTAASITYDPAKIQDAGKVFGTLEDVIAPKQQQKSAIVEEVNRLLFMNLVEARGEIHRFWVDLVPAAADITYDYARGSSVYFSANERSKGDINAIVNSFVVNGLTYPCGTPVGTPPKPPCRCTIVAKSNGNNTALGSGVRVEPGRESSALLQDESFAIWYAQELLRILNRAPDILILTAPFDPERFVGETVGIVDNARGIFLSASAPATPYLVERIDVQDFTMTCRLRGASTGFTVNSSSDVEKQCNQTRSAGPSVAPGFTPPAPWPMIFEAVPPWLPCQQPTNPVDCTEGAFVAATATAADFDWKVSGTIVLNDIHDSMVIGVDATPGQFRLTIAGHSFYSAFMLEPQLYELNAPGEYEHRAGAAPLGVPIDYILQWDDAAETLTAWIRVNDEMCYTDTVVYTAASLTSAETFRTVTGAPTLTAQAMKLDCGAPPSPPADGCFTPDGADWNDQTFDVVFGTGTVDFIDMSEDGEIVLTEHTIVGGPGPSLDITAPRFMTWSGRIDFTGPGVEGVDAPFVSLVLQDDTSFDFAGVQMEWYPDPGAPGDGDGFIYLYGFGTGFAFHQLDLPASDLFAGFNLKVTWDTVLNTVSYDFLVDSGVEGLDNIVNSVALDTGWSTANLKFGCAAGGTVIELNASAIEICITTPA